MYWSYFYSAKIAACVIAFCFLQGSAAQNPISLQSSHKLDSVESHKSSPHFEVATIKPADPSGNGMLGFLSYPGGRVKVGGATVRMLVGYAFNIQPFQIEGLPDWTTGARFDIEALPPDSPEAHAKQQTLTSATPSEEQRQMILRLLIDRFGLQYDRSRKEGVVYFQVRSDKPTGMTESQHKQSDSRGGLGIDIRGVPNGDVFGMNLSMEAFARSLGRDVERPVVDHTGLSGTYDFRIKASEPNQGDAMDGVLLALQPLGLRLIKGKGAVETIRIESVSRPSDN